MIKKSKEEIINTAIEYYKSGWYEGAVIECQKALALDPNYVRAYHGIARSQANLQKYHEALWAYSKVLSFKETSELYTQRGDVHYAKKDYAAASNDYYRAIALDPNNKEAIIKKAKANNEVNKYMGRPYISNVDAIGYQYISSGYGSEEAEDYYGYFQDWETYTQPFD